MTLSHQHICAEFLCGKVFPIGVTATANLTDALSAIQAVDNALDATLANAVTAAGGTTTVINALAAQLPSPWSTMSAADQVMVAVVVFLGRGNII